ncbi:MULTISPECIES: hypothetical protein [unclassified Flavobacterium]|uniref:hypothetical protein n=1 Tax=unclassified Flavobacterium TaxID=196869 RepID=UPI003F908208
MKKVIIFCTLLFTLGSCSNDNIKVVATEYQGQWNLYQMSGSMMNSETTGAAMEWQENYIFNKDGSFKKSRTNNGVKKEITGSFIVKKIQQETYLELSYKTDSELIGSCYGNNKEELFVLPNSVLSSTWKNCDGPGLEYKKVQ